MKVIGGIIGAPLKAIGLIPKTPKATPPPKPVTIDDARDAAAKEEALRKRQGSLADVVTGTAGAEAGATGKSTLG